MITKSIIAVVMLALFFLFKWLRSHSKQFAGLEASIQAKINPWLDDIKTFTVTGINKLTKEVGDKLMFIDNRLITVEEFLSDLRQGRVTLPGTAPAINSDVAAPIANRFKKGDTVYLVYQCKIWQAIVTGVSFKLVDMPGQDAVNECQYTTDFQPAGTNAPAVLNYDQAFATPDELAGYLVQQFNKAVPAATA